MLQILTPSIFEESEAMKVDNVAHQFFGKHLIASYKGCDMSILLDHTKLMAVLEEGIRRSGATILSASSHGFPGGGLTAVFLLSESHASIHTYPEYEACFIDMFTCGDLCDPNQFASVLVGHLKPHAVQQRVLRRDESIVV